MTTVSVIITRAVTWFTQVQHVPDTSTWAFIHGGRWIIFIWDTSRTGPGHTPTIARFSIRTTFQFCTHPGTGARTTGMANTMPGGIHTGTIVTGIIPVLLFTNPWKPGITRADGRSAVRSLWWNDRHQPGKQKGKAQPCEPDHVGGNHCNNQSISVLECRTIPTIIQRFGNRCPCDPRRKNYHSCQQNSCGENNAACSVPKKPSGKASLSITRSQQHQVLHYSQRQYQHKPPACRAAQSRPQQGMKFR